MNWLRDAVLRSKFWMWFYAGQTLLWTVTFPPAILLWKESVVYLVILSQIAALLGALGGLAGVLAERKANEKIAVCDPEEQES